MQRYILIIGVLLVANSQQLYGSQQIQMPESAAFTTDEDLVEQLDRIKHNVTELWTNFNELKTVLTQTLNHLRVHQAELEETVHMLEHKHDGTGSAPGAYTDDHHHHHSGEQHSDDSHSHGSDDHHHHSGEQHSHDGDHSHSGDSHSHGSDSHHGSDDDHHHSGEQHYHGSNHYHSSYSHSHSHPGHEMDGDNHQHGDSHEKGENLQQAQQGADSMVEPLIQPTNVQQHYHHQQPHMGTASNSLQLITDNHFNSHHHHHHTQKAPHRSQRNRTVEIPKFTDYTLYDFAVCNVQANRAIPEDQQQDIIGRINLWQKKTGGPLNIHVRLQGFDMGDHHHHDAQQSLQKEEDNETPVTVVHKHGFHIHTLGDLSNGCQSTGPHYNPKNVNHGGPNALVRHVGDLGNIECDDHGHANILFNDEIASLKGPYSVVGKSIVIHSKTDDYGLGGDEESLKTGNAGTRLACCVIEKVEKLPIRSYKYIKAATLYQN